MSNLHTVKAVKRKNSVITHYLLDNDQVITTDEALDLCEKGLMANMHIGHSRDGKPFVATNRNYDEGDNLSSLPTF